MRPSCQPSSLALLVLAAPLASATNAQSQAPSPPAVLTQDLCGLNSVDGELWAGGNLYKARFDALGMTYVPALGEEAARSLPLSVKLLEATRGGEPATLLDAEAVRGDELQVRRDRGGLVEVYDVQAAGVELSYAFSSLPSGQGDLVLRLAVDTELSPPSVGTYTGGVQFDAGAGITVSVGSVLAIDASGRSVAGQIDFDGRDLSLVVPASFVDTAVLPLIVDPLIATTQISNGYGDHRAPDVAYDATTGNYLVVWQRYYSSIDSDIWAYRLDSSGVPTGGSLFLETTVANSAVLPCVGNVADSDRFLAVWQEDHPTQGWNIVAMAIKASDGSMSSRVVLGSTSNHEEWPDISGTANADDVTVVWEEDNVGIKGRTVQVPPTGNPVPGSTFTYTADPDAHRPAISKSSDSIGTQLLVWQKYYPTPAPGDHDLFAMAIASLGHSVSPALFVAGAFGPDESDPSVDGDGHRWVIAYEYGDSLFSLDREIRAAAVTQTGYGYVVDETQVFVDDVVGVDDTSPAVANVGDSYLVAYTSQSFLDTDFTVRVRTLDPWCADCNDFTALEGPHKTIGTPLGIVSKRSGSFSAAPSDEALIVYSTFLTGIGDGQIQASSWQTENGKYTGVTTSCSPSYSFAPCARVGNSNFTHRLLGSDPGVQSWLLIGQTPGPFVCGTGGVGGACYLAVDPFSAFITDAGDTDVYGRAAVTTPLPDSPALAGLAFYEQWATVPAFGSGSCVDIGVNLSDGLLITIE